AVPPPSPTPTAKPAPADLSAEGPAQAVSLVPGGDPVDLPITVRNTGGSVSEPISATLNLPPGVRAVSGPNRLTHNALLRFDAPRQSTQRSDSVRCPGGTGSVTCGTTEGLNPGDSVTLLFRLVADSGATGGQISGTVSAGRQLTVSVSVPVVVQEPATTDGVDVRAQASADGWFSHLWPWQRDVILRVRVVNTGTSTKAVSLGVDEGGRLLASTRPLQCAETPSQMDCATEPLAPNQAVNVVFRLGRGHDHPHDGKSRRITVTAVLGTATDQDTVRIPWAHGPGWPGHVSASATNTKPTSDPSDPAEPTKHRVPTKVSPTPPAPVVPTPTPEPPPSTEPGTMPTPLCIGGDHRPKRWDVPCPS
ncbi:MAG: sigma-70 family RNA polymerase sigma factor, partial [Actinokineospora sp.]